MEAATYAVVEEHEHASVDGRGEEQSHCNWDRVERGFGRAEGEHRQPDRHDQADAERPEVRREVRKPDRGLEITGGVEWMRPLEEEDLGGGVHEQYGGPDREVETHVARAPGP